MNNWPDVVVAEVVSFRAQELCESRGERPGLPVPNSPCGLCGCKATFEEEEEKEEEAPPTDVWTIREAATTTGV